MDLLGPDYPTDVDTGEDRLNDRDLDNQLESLDARCYDLEVSTNADARLNEYLARTQRRWPREPCIAEVPSPSARAASRAGRLLVECSIHADAR
jgi:hypothetical protein